MLPLLVLLNAISLTVTVSSLRDQQYQLQGVEVQEVDFLDSRAPYAVVSRRRRKRDAVGDVYSIPLRGGGSTFGGVYYYPERRKLPLAKCFHNPTGYICCNVKLNNKMVDTYKMLAAEPKFNPCNIQKIADRMQMEMQKTFNSSFETLVAHDDFAQKVSFRGDKVCKIELGGKYMIAYATPSQAYDAMIPRLYRQKREIEMNWGNGLEDSWTSIHETFI